jgi:hypothetical protein
MLDNHAAVQVVCTDVARALAAGTLDIHIARQIGITVGIALRTLPRPAVPEAGSKKEESAAAPEPVAEIILTPEGEEIAPVTPYDEAAASPSEYGPSRSSSTARPSPSTTANRCPKADTKTRKKAHLSHPFRNPIPKPDSSARSPAHFQSGPSRQPSPIHHPRRRTRIHHPAINPNQASYPTSRPKPRRE